MSVSRILELFLAIYFMLAIADTLQRNPKLYRTALDVYVTLGALSAIASICSVAVFEATGTYSYFINDLDYRARGFFNEGGPYGLFLVSVLLVLWLRGSLYSSGLKALRWIGWFVIWAALFLSASKAGLLAAILCSLAAILKRSLRIRAALAVAVPTAGMLFLILFQDRLEGYQKSLLNFDVAASLRPADRNLVMGRIVAAFVIPRMIAAHPLLGIGIGNYSLMRNDPDYLNGLPAVDDWDLPGWGLVSDSAELGIPVAVALFCLLLRPLWRAKKSNASTALLASSAFQPAALLVGVNLNFFYPWLVTAFVLAALAWQRPRFSAAPAHLLTGSRRLL